MCAHKHGTTHAVVSLKKGPLKVETFLAWVLILDKK